MSEQTTNPMTVSLPNETDIVLTRTFNAPARLVFEALTQTEHVPHWWGFSTDQMLVCEIDLRVGGGWRYVTSSEDGSGVGFNGEFREISPYNRLVYTEIYEAMPTESSLVTITLEERDGKTLYTSSTTYSSLEVRDMVVASGMEYGARESLDRLEARVATMIQTTA